MREKLTGIVEECRAAVRE